MTGSNNVMYHAVCRATSTGWSGFFPSLIGCVATGKDWDKLISNLSEALALHLMSMEEDGEKIPPSDKPSDTYLNDKYPESNVVAVRPSEINPLSLEIGRVIEETGKSLRELEKETGIGYTVLSRLQDPFYWGHSLKSIMTFADALHLKPQFKFLR